MFYLCDFCIANVVFPGFREKKKNATKYPRLCGPKIRYQNYMSKIKCSPKKGSIILENYPGERLEVKCEMGFKWSFNVV